MSSTVAGSRLFNADEARGNLWHGEWRAASAVLDVTEPATGESLLEVGRAGRGRHTRRRGGGRGPRWMGGAPGGRTRNRDGAGR